MNVKKFWIAFVVVFIVLERVLSSLLTRIRFSRLPAAIVTVPRCSVRYPQVTNTAKTVCLSHPMVDLISPLIHSIRRRKSVPA